MQLRAGAGYERTELAAGPARPTTRSCSFPISILPSPAICARSRLRGLLRQPHRKKLDRGRARARREEPTPASAARFRHFFVQGRGLQYAARSRYAAPQDDETRLVGGLAKAPSIPADAIPMLKVASDRARLLTEFDALAMVQDRAEWRASTAPTSSSSSSPRRCELLGRRRRPLRPREQAAHRSERSNT